MSVGGVFGGVFAALIAPLVFDWTYEYPILILAAGALVPQNPLFRWAVDYGRESAQQGRIVVLATALVVVLLIVLALTFPGSASEAVSPIQGLLFAALVTLGVLVSGVRAAFVVTLAGALIALGGYRSLVLSMQPHARTRSYFGIYTVLGGEAVGVRQLKHGTTVHGTRLLGSPQRERTPTAYYVPSSGIGQAMQAVPSLYGDHARIGVGGLGSGTLACYARPGQNWRVYEIDPAIVHIARDTGQFTFLGNCLPHPRIEVGDARLNLFNEPGGSLDLLALDAFSSDSVPMHLMTREAFASYARVLAPGGLLLVHIS